MATAEDETVEDILHQARKCIEENEDVDQCIELLELAQSMQPSDKISRKLNRMYEYKSQKRQIETETKEENPEASDKKETEDVENELPSGHRRICDGFTLHKRIADKLFLHQKEGVQYLYRLFRNRKGGILGDDMGLGKTVQVVALLSGLFDSKKIQTVMIVMPVSVLLTWQKEFERWANNIRIYTYHECSVTEGERYLSRVHKRGGVLLTTYGMVQNRWQDLSQKTYSADDHIWDLVILDEGHKIKNPYAKTSKALRGISSKVRIVLTGTPIMNNVSELWALYDYIHNGTLLGSQKTFNMEYEKPITKSREKNASMQQREYGQRMAESLRRRIEPYFFRRTKQQVDMEAKAAVASGTTENVITMPAMTRKNDFVIWMFLSEIQIKVYTDFLELDSVKELLTKSVKRSPLVELTVLKKICDSPRLLTQRQCIELDIQEADAAENEAELDDCAANKCRFIPDEALLKECGKLQILLELLKKFKAENHRCLVFSQSKKMLNIVQQVLTNAEIRCLRLDGDVKTVAERQMIIKKFENRLDYTALLLTTQVGGVGLTLTAANRVIIFDPSWNPAVDNQAVDRAFRIGQKSNVVIYRLITCGTVEEKIYRRQIFKDSIVRQTTGIAKTDSNPYRYFTNQDLYELFKLDDPHSSTTQQQLEELHAGQRKSDTTLDSHIAFLYSLNIFGVSDHDLMFQSTGQSDLEPEHLEQAAGVDENYMSTMLSKIEANIERECVEAAHGISKIDLTDKPRKPSVPQVFPQYGAELNIPKPPDTQSQPRSISASSLPKYEPELFIPKRVDTTQNMMNQPRSISASSLPKYEPELFIPKKVDTARHMMNQPRSISASSLPKSGLMKPSLLEETSEASVGGKSPYFPEEVVEISDSEDDSPQDQEKQSNRSSSQCDFADSSQESRQDTSSSEAAAVDSSERSGNNLFEKSDQENMNDEDSFVARQNTRRPRKLNILDQLDDNEMESPPPIRNPATKLVDESVDSESDADAANAVEMSASIIINDSVDLDSIRSPMSVGYSTPAAQKSATRSHLASTPAPAFKLPLQLPHSVEDSLVKEFSDMSTQSID